MLDVLATQHSKWTARRIRRALFGQSLADFTANPWVGIKDQDISASQESKKKKKGKPSRLERQFSQTEQQFSQTECASQSTSSSIEMTVCDSSQNTTLYNSTSFIANELEPNGSVYFSSDPHFQNISYFQDFSNLHEQIFHFPSFQCPHFRNEQQEQSFSTSFLVPLSN